MFLHSPEAQLGQTQHRRQAPEDRYAKKKKPIQKGGEREQNHYMAEDMSVAFPDQMDTERRPPTKMTTSAFSASAIIIKQNMRELKSSGYW